MRATVTNALIIAMSLAFLWHFSRIWLYGQYLIGEPNILIRTIETNGLMMILAFGILNLLYEWGEEKSRRR